MWSICTLSYDISDDVKEKSAGSCPWFGGVAGSAEDWNEATLGGHEGKLHCDEVIESRLSSHMELSGVRRLPCE